MKFTWINLLLCLLLVQFSFAQATIEGTITIGEDNSPAPFAYVDVFAGDDHVGYGATNTDGEYFVQVLITDATELRIESYDLCTGDLAEETVTLADGEAATDVDFWICQEFEFPGWPTEDCGAYWGIIAEDSLTLTFGDESIYDVDEGVEWHWDFGDGNTSTEEDPTHTYAEAGTYIITLTLTNGDCESVRSDNLTVPFDDNPGDCGCDLEYEPVCIDIIDEETGGTYTITYPNACWAECEGFTADDFVDCDFGGDCDCDWTDYTPVCVDVVDEETGETYQISYPNTCFAECEGYTADDFVDCEMGGGVDDCDCDWTEFDPVCVEVMVDSTTSYVETFPSACLAECLGYTADDFVDCEMGGGVDDCDCDWMEYDPVCVEVMVDSTTSYVETFPSACFAECEGYTADDFVDCGDMGGCDCDWMEYDPVCVDVVDEASGETYQMTFPSACFAECEGYTADDFVDCEMGGGIDDCDCDWTVYDPVCVEVVDESTGATYEITFPSTCWAECEGYTADDFVDCGNMGGCDCDWMEYDPVCVDVVDEVSGETYQMTFPSACFAECEGYTADDFVDCEMGGGIDDCDCDWAVFDPVCVEVAMGNDSTETCIVTFPSACFAECEGYTADDFVDCGDDSIGGVDDCGCGLAIDPVCVDAVDEFSGETYQITFPNACWAECEGYTADDFVDCEEDNTGEVDDCGCDWSIIDQVCVEVFDGFVVPFQNACDAECAGFTAEDFVDCDDDFWGPTIGNEQTGASTFLQQGTQNGVEWVSNATLSPNPVVDITAIEFTASADGLYEISIIGIDGRTISATSISAVKGENTHILNAENLEAGMYLINITNDVNSKTLKMIKQ